MRGLRTDVTVRWRLGGSTQMAPKAYPNGTFEFCCGDEGMPWWQRLATSPAVVEGVAHAGPTAATAALAVRREVMPPRGGPLLPGVVALSFVSRSVPTDILRDIGMPGGRARKPLAKLPPVAAAAATSERAARSERERGRPTRGWALFEWLRHICWH